VDEWDAALGREGALPKEVGKKARIIASSSISPPSAMGPLAAGEVEMGDLQFREHFFFSSERTGSVWSCRYVPDPARTCFCAAKQSEAILQRVFVLSDSGGFDNLPYFSLKLDYYLSHLVCSGK
jgi:hypothetical protein